MANDETIHIRLETGLKQELEKHANIYGMKLSQVTRIALEEYAYRDHELTTTTLPKINTEKF